MRLLILGLILTQLIACAAVEARLPLLAAEPKPAPIILGQAAVPEEGSVWSETHGLQLFTDPKARRVGDIITVNIVETSKAAKKAATKTKRASEIGAGVENFMGMAEALMGHNPHITPATMVKGSMSNKFAGEGETSRSSTLTASISATVIQVLPNGNLAIRGTRGIRVNNENQIMVLSGMVRPEDIAPNNTVLSSFIADARIEYYGRGPLGDKQRAGWMTRILDFIWPF